MVIRDEVRRLPAYHFTHHPQPIKLDQNEAPPDDDGALAQAMAVRLASVALNRYPPLHPADLERALAERCDWDPAGVVVANGSNVLIQAAVIAAGLGRSVLTVTPNFPVYASQARLLGAEVVEVPLGDGFELPVDELIRALGGRSGVAFVTDPAAPTGNGHDPAEVGRFVRAASETGRWLTVIDEAYVEFVGSDHLDLARGLQNVAVLRTFSKAAGLAGARLGYLLAESGVARELRKALLPFCVSSLQVAAAFAALENQDIVNERVRLAVAERDRLAASLARLPGVTVFPSVTNFVLFRVPEPSAVHRALLGRGIVVRRQDHLPGLEGCLRVSAGSPHENDAFLAAMEEITRAEEPAHG